MSSDHDDADACLQTVGPKGLLFGLVGGIVIWVFIGAIALGILG